MKNAIPLKATLIFDAILKLHKRLDVSTFTYVSPTSPINADGNVANGGVIAGADRRQLELLQEKARLDLWLLSLNTLCKLCRDQRVEIRRHASDTLLSALIASNITMPHPKVFTIVYDQLLFPLAEQVLQLPPETAASGSNNTTTEILDIRPRIFSVLFQTFLHHLDIICQMPDFHRFWLQFLNRINKCLQRLLDLSQQLQQQQTQLSAVIQSSHHSLITHILESLKNMLLVMHSSALLDRLSQELRIDLISQTFVELQQFPQQLRQPLIHQLAIGGLVPRMPIQTQQPQAQQQQPQPQQYQYPYKQTMSIPPPRPTNITSHQQ